MNFGFTEEQQMLRDQIRKFLDEKCPSETVRTLMKSDTGYSPELWKQMADLGWLGLIVPVEYGGSGLSWVDLIVILEEMGRSLYPSPFISTTLAASTLAELASEEQKKLLLNDLANGSKIATLAILDSHYDPSPANVTLLAQSQNKGRGNQISLTGEKHFVADAGVADIFILACRLNNEPLLALVNKDQQGISVTSSPTMDETKRTGTLKLDNVLVDSTKMIRITDDDLVRLFDKGSVAVTAEMVGAAESVTRITTDYARDRIQFDHPIGKYQGVKHRLAEMYVDVESFKSLLYYAAWTVDESPEELPRSASLAKAYAADAFIQIGIEGVQLHGAIGFTEEYDIQLFLKRSKWARPMYGDSDFHYDRAASLGGL